MHVGSGPVEAPVKEAAPVIPAPEDLGDGYQLVHSENGAMLVIYKYGGLIIARAVEDRKGIKDAITFIEARIERLRTGSKPNVASPPAEAAEADGVAEAAEADGVAGE